jgi:putative PIN family toxin of toxin-antitoxin system
MIPKQAAISVERIVIDTNVCLDLFVFRDPRWQLLLNAMQQRRVQAVTRADCRMEWTLVLAYTKLKLDADTQMQTTAEFDALIQLLDVPPPEPAIKLPLCRDTDDQKFLELAYASGAAVLISKDKALLKLARKTERMGLFRIMTPERWVELQAASSVPLQ